MTVADAYVEELRKIAAAFRPSPLQKKYLALKGGAVLLGGGYLGVKGMGLGKEPEKVAAVKRLGNPIRHIRDSGKWKAFGQHRAAYLRHFARRVASLRA